MWRRLKWYEGIVGVQRLLPMYSGARPDASVQVVIPAGTMQGAQDILPSAGSRWRAPTSRDLLCRPGPNLSPAPGR